MPLSWDAKDPDEVLDYQLDWSPRLSGDTISTSSWLVPAGLTTVLTSETSTVSTIWLSGGTVAQSYLLRNRIVTAGGRTMDQSVRLRVREK